jgi:CHASE1-domain containing sensor protein
MADVPPENLSRSATGRPRMALPYTVLAASLVLTALGTAYVAMSVEARDRLRFQSGVRRAEQRVTARIDTYTAMLRATKGLFAVRFPVAPDEFARFAAQLDLRKNYPGVFGIGFALRFPMDGKHGFEQFMIHAAKFEGFQVWPQSSLDEGAAIVYLEPKDERNAKALGYDMYSDPLRRAAMQQARDEGSTVASGKVTLIQDKDDSHPAAGFLIYMPVYQGGVDPGTTEERRKILRGWVYSPFRADDLFGDTLAEERQAGLAVRI